MCVSVRGGVRVCVCVSSRQKDNSISGSVWKPEPQIHRWFMVQIGRKVLIVFRKIAGRKILLGLLSLRSASNVISSYFSFSFPTNETKTARKMIYISLL